MRLVLDHLVESLHRNESVILAAIVRNTGSAPRTSGARMLIRPDRSLVGSVGGGALEGACQARADEMFAQSESFAILDFTLTATSAAEAGMVCGGNVSVLLMQIGPQSLEIFSRLKAAYADGQRAFLVTELPRVDAAPSITCLCGEEDNTLTPGLRDELLRKARRAPFLLEFEGRELFVEPLIHPGTVHLVGAGHVALATAECAAFAGFDIVVMDDREEFANANRYPQAREVRVLESFTGCLRELGADDYVVIVTRGHLHDKEVLEQALRTGAGYIGMIGSRKKRDAVYAALVKEGFSESDLHKIYCPIGLKIGADTPEEIAVSIVAELVQARAGKSQ